MSSDVIRSRFLQNKINSIGHLRLKRQETIQVSQMQTINQTMKTACYMIAKDSEIML